MIRAAFLMPAALMLSTVASAAPLSSQDVATLKEMTQQYVDGWLQNDRSKVMANLSKDAVFIPHHGVKPHIGYEKIDEFWFPGGKPVGVVVAFTKTITDISGADDHATIYGRSDLKWQDDKQRYRWIGNYLFVARRDPNGWVFTHMMSSDEQPTVEPVGAK